MVGRRIGTILFFSFTYLAQLLLVAQLYRLRELLPAAGSLPRFMLATCAVLLLLGLVTVTWEALDEATYTLVENAFEWLLSLLLQFNILLGYLLWWRTGWQLEVSK